MPRARPSSSSKDSVTAAVTLPPTVESTRTSTPSPSAAIDRTVKRAAALVTGAIATSGTNCTQYRYSNVLNPNVATVTRPSLYAIRVGVKFQF